MSGAWLPACADSCTHSCKERLIKGHETMCIGRLYIQIHLRLAHWKGPVNRMRSQVAFNVPGASEKMSLQPNLISHGESAALQ